MNTILADEHPTLGTSTGRGTEVCDPQMSVSELIGDVLKDVRSKHAVLQLAKLAGIMAVTPWLLSFLAEYLDWDDDLWAKASLFGVNVVIGLYVLLAWREDQQERQELEKDKTE